MKTKSSRYQGSAHEAAQRTSQVTPPAPDAAPTEPDKTEENSEQSQKACKHSPRKGAAQPISLRANVSSSGTEAAAAIPASSSDQKRIRDGTVINNETGGNCLFHSLAQALKDIPPQ